MSKEDIRQEMKHARKLLSPQERISFSQKICERLAAFAGSVTHSQIIAYWPLSEEVNILPFLQSQNPNLQIYVLSKNHQQLLQMNTRLVDAEPIADMKTLRKIEERLSPISIVDLANTTLVICPGLAFGKDGSRIGYGGGYFDKLLSIKSLQFIKVGVCSSAQLFETVPQQADDQKMEWIITEKSCFKAGS